MTQHAHQRRADWLRLLLRWHWISAAIALGGIGLFALTGLTLNHASQIESTPRVERGNATLPEPLVVLLRANTAEHAPLPAAVRAWLTAHPHVATSDAPAEWNEDEVTLNMPGPGRDAWVTIQRSDGSLEYEITRRGTIAWLNDLHKGRNTGAAWTWFIDLVAVACVVFALTGLLLLQLHARQRRSTWPLVALGFVLPVVLLLLFVH